MQAELSCEYNFTADSRTRAGRALGRCHAALGQHTLSVAALDAALEQAQMGRRLVAEYLAVKLRAGLGREAGGAAGHWNAHAGAQRVAEVVGRLQGDRQQLLEEEGMPEQLG